MTITFSPDITITWLATQLQLEQNFADEQNFVDSDGALAGLEVRLQVSPDGQTATLHVGDSIFDQDHTGFWGYGGVFEHDDWNALMATAEDMIEQALEHAMEP